MEIIYNGLMNVIMVDIMQSSWKRLPKKNQRDAKRILASFERRIKELRVDLDALYKDAKFRETQKRTSAK
mgnify:CR=1 FL=1